MNQDSKPQRDAETIEDEEMLDEYDFSQAVRRQSPSRQDKDIHVKIESDNGSREVRIKTIEVSAIVSEDNTVTIQLPSDITPGEHRIVLMIEDPAS